MFVSFPAISTRNSSKCIDSEPHTAYIYIPGWSFFVVILPVVLPILVLTKHCAQQTRVQIVCLDSNTVFLHPFLLVVLRRIETAMVPKTAYYTRSFTSLVKKNCAQQTELTIGIGL